MITNIKYYWAATFLEEIIKFHDYETGSDKRFFSLLGALHESQPDRAHEILNSSEIKTVKTLCDLESGLISIFDAMIERNKNYYHDSFIKALQNNRDILKPKQWLDLIGNLNGNTVGAWCFFAEEFESKIPVKFTNQSGLIKSINDWMIKLNVPPVYAKLPKKIEKANWVVSTVIGDYIIKPGFLQDHIRVSEYMPGNSAWNKILGIQDNNPAAREISSFLDCSLEVGGDLLTEHYLVRILKAFAK